MKTADTASGGRITHNGKHPLAWLPLCLLVVGGCSGNPVRAGDRLAESSGAVKEVIDGVGNHHVAYFKGPRTGARSIRVYIGGDGRAFIRPRQVARDPTPQRPLALRLMLADPAAAVYLSRPCYHGSSAELGCSPHLWTTGRYSESVVASMTTAIEAIATRYPDAELTLIGYSGGGVIALLCGARLPRVSAVVTLAAPLAVEAWTSAHDYTPLHDSLDPARHGSWPKGMRQIHLQGALDDNVSPAQTASFRSANQDAAQVEFRIIEGIDHGCCWEDLWPSVLAGLDSEKPSSEWHLSALTR